MGEPSPPSADRFSGARVAHGSVALPRTASSAEGVHNMEILEAAVESATNHGKKVVL